MSGQKTKIITYLNYESLFEDFQKGKLIVPISYLNDSKNIDSSIVEIIKNFDSVEAISYSSFLNAIVQTCDVDESLRLGMEEIKKLKLTNRSHVSGILFHRDNLLYLISQIIQKNKNGTLKITGPGNSSNLREYYKSLLLISSKLNKSEGDKRYNVLKDYFIRAYPYYYSPKTSFVIYSTRIQRYWHIYSEILIELDLSSITEGIKIIEEKTNISLKEYVYVVGQILMWFLQIPYERNTARNGGLNNLGFNYKHISTFYINKDKFGSGESFIKLIDHLSIDLEGMKQKFLNDQRRDKIEGFYEHFQNFFDKPIFKIDENNYCIIDLKFLIEGMCSGFIWHLNDLSPVKFEQIKDQYGHLVEEYFIFLVTKIFKGVLITNKETNQPDAILELDDYIIIFEFTTEYYKFASLYNTNTKEILDDLYKIFFNEGKTDNRGRGKKDKGKFLKLENYIKVKESKGKKIIPVIITENYIGDYDLIDNFDRFIEKEISNKQLNRLKKHKPLIINLDDLEIFWAFSEHSKASQEFVQYIQSWEKSDKGSFHYNFSYFIIEQTDGLIKNNDYKKFFNFQKFITNQ